MVDHLREALAKAEQKSADLAAELKDAQYECDDLRDKLGLIYSPADAVWRWVGDGQDHPESMLSDLPVVMSAETLREMLAKTGREVESSAVLWAHLVSAHAACIRPDLPLNLLIEIHEHEHNGPCTIRNHPHDDRSFTMTKLIGVLSESEDTFVSADKE